MRPTSIRGSGHGLFAADPVAHLPLTVAPMVMAVGAAFAAHEGEPPRPTDDVVLNLAGLRTAPIAAARWVLPEAIRPGVGLPEPIVNRLLRAAAVTALVRPGSARRASTNSSCQGDD